MPLLSRGAPCERLPLLSRGAPCERLPSVRPSREADSWPSSRPRLPVDLSSLPGSVSRGPPRLLSFRRGLRPELSRRPSSDSPSLRRGLRSRRSVRSRDFRPSPLPGASSRRPPRSPRVSRRAFGVRVVVTSGPPPPPSSSRRSLGSARARGLNTAVISSPSSPPSASTLKTDPTAALSGTRSPETSPLGRRAPAARQVQVPSSRWLVSSISSRRDTAHKATRPAAPSRYRRKCALCKVRRERRRSFAAGSNPRRVTPGPGPPASSRPRTRWPSARTGPRPAPLAQDRLRARGCSPARPRRCSRCPARFQ